MLKKIVIVCFGFEAQHLRSQPWHMAHGLATQLSEDKHQVTLITDVNDIPSTRYEIKKISSIFTKKSPSSELIALLQAINAEMTFFFIGSHELLKPGRFKVPGNAYLVVSNSRFSIGEIARIKFWELWGERNLLLRPVVSSLIPGWMLARGFAQTGAKDIIYVSEGSQQRYHKVGLPKGQYFRPVVDQSYGSSLSRNSKQDQLTLCYFGPPLFLRGVSESIQAFEKAAARNPKIHLKLLIRLREETEYQQRYRKLLEQVKSSTYSERIHIDDRYMTPAELKAELDQSDIFLLPFKITVSDSPLVIIESALTGKPVVTLDTPGVTEFVNEFGGVTCKQVDQLSGAILEACNKQIKSGKIDTKWLSWSASVNHLMDGLLSENS